MFNIEIKLYSEGGASQNSKLSCKEGVMEKIIREFEQALLAMDRERADVIVQNAEAEPVVFVEAVMVPALERIGEGWEVGDVSLSQVYMSGRICEDFINERLPPEDTAAKSHPPIALAVLEDYHMLGKRLVSSVLTANRIAFFDYGRVETEDLVRRVEHDQVKILLISTLMLPSALQVGELVRQLAGRGLDVKVIVGGAPFRFDKMLYREVGADGTAERASDVVSVIRQVTGGADAG